MENKSEKNAYILIFLVCLISFYSYFSFYFMLAYLSGKIINKGADYIIVRVQDVGYKVFVNSKMYAGMEIGGLVDIYTHQHIREDASDLYGFNSLADLQMFELLLSISGIGPKSASAVLSIAGVDDIKEAIAAGDSSLLTKVSGIGKKTAERVILELRGKIGAVSGANSDSAGGGAAASGDEIDALMALGYSLSQAREALGPVDKKIKDSGERIKAALSKLGK